ncbi:hypothetical protein RchiOBHm_Chr2g0165331 [Rosa chinensis]|uniref:Uncharacterized protein n=1 Tax=Rosa chinensis TaxID=74649 RepID=A0A2P6S3S2_ROSCH|nr:hypothetical protein RchiOBHm_Chr2g0165331 [Rosa chinensis]
MLKGLLLEPSLCDLECIFTVICNVVTNSDSLDEVCQMAELISGKVTQQPNDKPASRLKIRFSVYLSALNLAINGKVTEHVLPSFKQIDSFLKGWNIGVLDQRQLFLTISNVLKERKSLAKESFKFLTKYMATLSGEDAPVLGQAKDEAVCTIVEFVKTPDMFQLIVMSCGISKMLHSTFVVLFLLCACSS